MLLLRDVLVDDLFCLSPLPVLLCRVFADSGRERRFAFVPPYLLHTGHSYVERVDLAAGNMFRHAAFAKHSLFCY